MTCSPKINIEPFHATIQMHALSTKSEHLTRSIASTSAIVGAENAAIPSNDDVKLKLDPMLTELPTDHVTSFTSTASSL
jgi:hypothetical protein